MMDENKKPIENKDRRNFLSKMFTLGTGLFVSNSLPLALADSKNYKYTGKDIKEIFEKYGFHFYQPRDINLDVTPKVILFGESHEKNLDKKKKLFKELFLLTKNSQTPIFYLFEQPNSKVNLYLSKMNIFTYDKTSKMAGIDEYLKNENNIIDGVSSIFMIQLSRLFNSLLYFKTRDFSFNLRNKNSSTYYICKNIFKINNLDEIINLRKADLNKGDITIFNQTFITYIRSSTSMIIEYLNKRNNIMINEILKYVKNKNNLNFQFIIHLGMLHIDENLDGNISNDKILNSLKSNGISFISFKDDFKEEKENLKSKIEIISGTNNEQNNLIREKFSKKEKINPKILINLKKEYEL